MMEITIGNLQENDCRMISAAFGAQGWKKPESRYLDTE